MSFANPSITDIVATTLQNRSGEIADNVTLNNAALAYLKKSGNVKPFSGGSQILEEISYAQNGNASWYSGYDLLSVAAQDVLSGAVYQIKQIACPVVISGLEELQNSGKEQIIDLLDARIQVAESTMANLMAAGVYSDGTGYGGKQLQGLGAAVVATPGTGMYAGIDPSVWAFWQNQVQNAGTQSTSTIQSNMNQLWAKQVRGNDRPNLIIFDTSLWTTYVSSLQANQRFTSSDTANLGFSTVKFMDCDVVLDGGLGGFAPTATGYFLNTKYIRLRPHSKRNMVPLSPNRRVAVNQDAEVEILAWAGAFTCNGRQFQGFFKGY